MALRILATSAWEDGHARESDQASQFASELDSDATFEECQTFHDEPSPEPSPVTLKTAISSAPQHEVVAALQHLAATLPTAQVYLEGRFLLAMPGNGSRKPKAMDVCGHCKEDYTVSENRKNCCMYHPGIDQLDLRTAHGLLIRHREQGSGR